MIHYDYHKPTTLEDALVLSEKSQGACYIAGGTDLLVQMRNRDIEPGSLVSLRNIDELKGIAVGEKTRVGAATSIAELIEHRALSQKYPVLAEAAKLVGSAQIRNTGTIGGNICNSSPCADTVLALLVLDAKVRLRSLGGAREVAICDFFVGPKQNVLQPGEILSDILLPPPSSRMKHALYKKGRVKMDLAITSVAILLEMEGTVCQKARIAAGSVAPTPLRLIQAENALKGKELTEKQLEKAALEAQNSVSPICDVRSTDEYRRHLVGVYLRRGVKKIMGWDAQ